MDGIERVSARTQASDGKMSKQTKQPVVAVCQNITSASGTEEFSSSITHETVYR